MHTDNALSVSQLNNYIKALMERDDVLSTVTLRGEISNFKLHSSGHMYFTLKDDRSEISAVMFRFAASKLNFAVKNGMRVVVYGKVSVYETTGKYQVYVNAMTADGLGALYAEYLRLLEKLRAEGLFEQSRKRPIPRFPRKIGIITSPTGAAIRDMINVTGRRYPCADILLCPSEVQGAQAPASLCRAMMMLGAYGGCDVIIIGRGGGSAEDLWAFNNEDVVRAVAASEIPVISAVGHETDTTLCDFAADLRAPTPSAAAELAVPDRYALLQKNDECAAKLDAAVRKLISEYERRIANAKGRIELGSPMARIEVMADRIAQSQKQLQLSIKAKLQNDTIRLSALAQKLDAVSPLAVLSRGYGLVSREDGRVISSTGGLLVGEKINIRVKDGSIGAAVTRVSKENENEE